MADSILTLLAPFARSETDPKARKMARRLASVVDYLVSTAPHSESTRVALHYLREARAAAIAAVLEDLP